MKIKEFTYTKPNGDISQRVVVELISPSEFVEGIDITELDFDSYSRFLNKFKALEAEIEVARNDLLNEFELTNNYRRFTPSRMTTVTTEYA